MDLVRLKINTMTASFRYPFFMIGYQPTFFVPPPSTIYGFLSAAKGEPVTPVTTKMGYVFEYEAVFEDLEAIYELEEKNILRAKSNIVKRQQLFNTTLWLYLSEELAHIVLCPYYPLFLGRSTDLATISDLKTVHLEELSDQKIRLGKTCLPFIPKDSRRGLIQALPTYLTDDIPRKPVGVRQYYLTDEFSRELKPKGVYRDPEHDWGVFLYDSSILEKIRWSS